MPRHLHDPADVDAPHSLYVDKDEIAAKRIDRECGLRADTPLSSH